MPGTISIARGKQLTELVVLNLARAVLIDVLYQFFNVNGHFELLFDDADKLLSVDEAITIR